MSLQVERRHGRATDPGQWGQNEKTSAPGSLRASRVRDVFVVGGATAVGYRCGSDSKSRANPGRHRRQELAQELAVELACQRRRPQDWPKVHTPVRRQAGSYGAGVSPAVPAWR
ncbi:hypothetical protein FW796_24450 [Pseudomonas sp. 910_21]